MVIHIEGFAALIVAVLVALLFVFACAAYTKYIYKETKYDELKLENRALIKENFHFRMMNEMRRDTIIQRTQKSNE